MKRSHTANRTRPILKAFFLLACLALVAAPFTAALAQGGDRPVPPAGRNPLPAPPKTPQSPLRPPTAPAAGATPAPATLGGAQQATDRQPAEPVEPITPLSMDEAQECLAAGETVYALALQNANVRSSADSASCRVGRIAKGTLVRLTGALTTQGGSPLAATAEAAASTPTPTVAPPPPEEAGPRLGYREDVQPIFSRVCNTCHSGIVKLGGLQVTEYAPLMTGSFTGTVVLPGDAANSRLWYMLDTGRMPMIGALTAPEKQLVHDWIEAGALENRPPLPAPAAEPVTAAAPTPNRGSGLWLKVAADDVNATGDLCAAAAQAPLRVVSSELVLPVSCGSAPARAGLDALRIATGLPGASRAATSMAIAPRPQTGAASSAGGAEATPADAQAAAEVAAAPQAAFAAAAAGDAGVQAQALGIAPPTDSDGWLTPRGGFCVERMLPKNTRGITAIAFAPDGRIFLAFDSQLAGDQLDPLILYDAYHPSRAIAVFDGVNESSLGEILTESTRVTGLDWADGALYVSRAGEVGTIPDGGEYKTLAGGFAVTSNLFHANNGIVISEGWVYVSAGGVIDGYSDGPIVGIGEEGAQQIVSGGNPFAARIVRAPLAQLLTDRSIGAFSTAARGVRNPYGITVDPAGRIWFTDNGATNLPDNVSAGDEVNVLNPGAIGAGEGNTPYYGFPLALSGSPPDWYAKPVLALENTAAPTGITWAYDTIWFGQYGRNPGLYRLARGADGKAVAERVLLGWPVLALATAPDGALWMGVGDGGLYRITPGCNN